MKTQVKTASEIAAMRESGRMLATVLQVLSSYVSPGISTKELSDIAARELKAIGGQPSFLGYQGFPEVLCASVNDEVVHGIPLSSKIIREGDIVSLDFGVTYKGMITDGATSVIAGKAQDSKSVQLLKITERALADGINVVRDQVRVGDISAAIEAVLSKHGYGIVRDLVGHGVGHELHEDPNIPNYGRSNTGPWLKSGMTVAIEPMATLGTDRVMTASNGWTISTQDNSRAAHFEHTVLVTDEGGEILTKL